MSYSQRESVVFNRRTSPLTLIVSGLTGWVSVLESISAVGDVIKPLVIYRGKLYLQPFKCWFPPLDECPHWFWGFTEKGWTNNEYALEWLTRVFIP